MEVPQASVQYFWSTLSLKAAVHLCVSGQHLLFNCVVTAMTTSDANKVADGDLLREAFSYVEVSNFAV